MLIGKYRRSELNASFYEVEESFAEWAMELAARIPVFRVS
jgi:hypothetical protein